MNNNLKVLGIYGAQGLGREVYELVLDSTVESERWCKIVFIDDNEKLVGSKVYDIPVISFDVFCNDCTINDSEIAIAVGEPAIRALLRNKVTRKGYHLATIIHPQARVSRWAKLEEGCIVTYDCNISCGTHLGTNSYFQPSCGAGHDTSVGDDSVISACVRIAGNVHVGNQTYIGMHTTVKEGLHIGNNVIVGMSSAVHRDIDDGLIAMGIPARPMRKNEDSRVFGKAPHKEK